MRALHIPFVTVVTALFLGFAGSAMAQITAPSSPIAPGADAPPSGIGAIGPGNVPIAPGGALSGDTNIERIGPGGGLIAPGPAGSGIGTPALPGSRVR